MTHIQWHVEASSTTWVIYCPQLNGPMRQWGQHWSPSFDDWTRLSTRFTRNHLSGYIFHFVTENWKLKVLCTYLNPPTSPCNWHISNLHGCLWFLGMYFKKNVLFNFNIMMVTRDMQTEFQIIQIYFSFRFWSSKKSSAWKAFHSSQWFPWSLILVTHTRT